MRRTLAAIAAATVAVALALPGPASAVGPTVDPNDDKIAGHQIEYVRHDGGTDTTIELCNETEDPAAFGAFTQNNEPFSVVSPTNPDLVVAGWNDYCSGWMGLGFSTDGGESWTDSLVPGYAGDTSAEGMASPEFGRTNAASDPVAAFNADGTKFYFGSISFNEFAGRRRTRTCGSPGTTCSEPGDPRLRGLPARLPRHDPGRQGPAAANFFGIFNDKEMVEVDRSPTSPFEGNLYECWTKFPRGPARHDPVPGVLGRGTVVLAAREPHRGRRGTGLRHRGRGRRRHLRDLARLRAQLVAQELRRLVREVDRRRAHVLEGSGRSRTSSPTTRSTRLGTAATGRTCARASSCSTASPARAPADPFEAASSPASSRSSTRRPGDGGAVGHVVLVGRLRDRHGRSVVRLHLEDDRQRRDVGARSGRCRTRPRGHAFFPDGDALAGRLAVVWQDSREDDCYSVQRPASNTARCDAVRGRRRRVGELVRRGLDGRRGNFGPAMTNRRR